MQSVTPTKIGTIDRSKQIVSQSSVLESMDTDKIGETASFPENVGAFSEEMGERFRQDLKKESDFLMV